MYPGVTVFVPEEFTGVCAGIEGPPLSLPIEVTCLRELGGAVAGMTGLYVDVVRMGG